MIDQDTKKYKTFRVEITYRAHQSDGEAFNVEGERKTWRWALGNFLGGPMFTHQEVKVTEVR